MKRSCAVAALLFGGISPVLVACGEDNPDTVTVYPSVEACTAEKAASDCAAAFAAARDEHQSGAPRFASRQACEAEMGDDACTPMNETQGASVSSVFVPAFVGFMIGRSLTGSHAQPVYFDRQGYARSGAVQIGRVPVMPVRQDDSQQASGGGSVGGSRFYYRSGGGAADKSITVPTNGRSAGFGSTGSLRGFSGS